MCLSSTFSLLHDRNLSVFAFEWCWRTLLIVSSAIASANKGCSAMIVRSQSCWVMTPSKDVKWIYVGMKEWKHSKYVSKWRTENVFWLQTITNRLLSSAQICLNDMEQERPWKREENQAPQPCGCRPYKMRLSMQIKMDLGRWNQATI
jgi:hypothetical protein